MEHLKTDGLFDRIDEILGYPSTDPHGSPIPDKNGEFKRKSYNTLSSFSTGSEIILRAVGDSSASLLTMLNEKNITLGTTFNISKVEDFDKTMIVSYGKERNISLSHEVCKRLLVETV